MIPLTPYALSGGLIGIFSLIFGLFVLLQGPNRKLARIWFLFNISLAFLGFSIAWIGSTRVSAQSLLAWHLAYYLSIPWIAPIFYHFVVVFLGMRRRRSIVIHYGIACAFLPFVHTDLFFTPLHWFRNSFYIPGAGPLLAVFVAWWMGLVIYAHALLVRSYNHVPDLKKSQIRYFLFATLLGFGGGNCGYLMHFGFDIYPWGAYAVAVYPFIMFLAIVKYQMWDIIIRKTLIYSMLTATLTTIYVAVLFLITGVLRRWVGSAGEYSPAIAACVIAILFHPVLQRIQHWVDRYFPRESLPPALLREATSGFVHEIKRPLTNITLPAEMALREVREMREERQGNPKLLSKVEDRLLYIMNQSVEAAKKIEAIQDLWDTSPVPREPFAFDLLVKELAVKQEPAFQKIGASFEVSIADGLPLIAGSPRQLETVLANLFKNADEALSSMEKEQERKLWLTLREENSQIVLTVKDSGPGIPSQNLPKLFLPYFSTKGSKGMGIGLYLAREIVQAHHGSLEVISKFGEGAEFIVRLPVVG
jgi:signal transduction histidine kinase